MRLELSFYLQISHFTVEALISGHNREIDLMSSIGAVCLLEHFYKDLTLAGEKSVR